jgi:hypothetical protein
MIKPFNIILIDHSVLFRIEEWTSKKNKFNICINIFSFLIFLKKSWGKGGDNPDYFEPTNTNMNT